jgi:hypothetical protein
MRKSSTIAIFALAAAALSSPLAIAATSFELNIGPPAPRYEVVPPPRTGYVWAPGYWDYNGHQHNWRKGHWERERHGEHYVAGGWTEHDGRWHLNQGHWEH